MKKRVLALLLCLLLPASAFAQVVGAAGMYGDEYIVAIEAPNGQTLYVLSREAEPHVTQADVNFDGTEDLVVLTTIGASNGYFQFFVWDGEQFVLATRNAGEDGGLPNYVLYPEQGLVGAQQHEGMAGAWHSEWLYRWEGTQLTLVRSAHGGPVREWRMDGETMITTEDSARVHLSVTRPAADGDHATLWEETVRLTDEAALRAALDREHAALWDGMEE